MNGTSFFPDDIARFRLKSAHYKSTWHAKAPILNTKENKTEGRARLFRKHIASSRENGHIRDQPPMVQVKIHKR
jgi:hypothetical protein